MVKSVNKDAQLSAMNFDLVMDRNITDEHFISVGGFTVMDKQGKEYQFDFYNDDVSVDPEFPDLLHVKLYTLDETYSDNINRKILSEAKFSDFHVYCGDGNEPEILPVKVDYLEFSFGNLNTIWENFDNLNESVNKSISYTRDDNTVVAENGWDFSQFTDKQFKISKAYYDIKAAEKVIKDNSGKEEIDKLNIDDIEFYSHNNDMFIKYRDLYIAPRIQENIPGDPMLLLDVYIPEKNLSKVNNLETVFKDFYYFDYVNYKKITDEHGEPAVYPDRIFIDKKNNKLEATACVLVDVNDFDFLSGKDIRTDRIFSIVKNNIIQCDPEVAFEKFSPYFTVMDKLTKDNQFQELIEAGDWHIDKEKLKKFSENIGVESYDIEEGEFFGYVNYGNAIYDIHLWPDPDNKGKSVFDLTKYIPNNMDMVNAVHRYKFDTVSWAELRNSGEYIKEDEILSGGFGSITADKATTSDINSFKTAIVGSLGDDPSFEFENADKYKKIKDMGLTFGQQYQKRLEALELLEKEKKYFPEEITGKNKLCFNDYMELSDYYKKIDHLVVDDESDIKYSDRLRTQKMVQDGLSDQRIINVIGCMFKDDEHKNNVSEILKSSEIKNYRKKHARFSRQPVR